MYDEPQLPLVAGRDRQRAEALAVGSSMRTRMAQLKKMIAKKEVDGVAVLLGHHEELQEAMDKLLVGQFLMSFPRFGELTRDEILSEMGLSGTTRMAHVTTTQRVDLARLIRIVRGDFR